MEFRQSKHISQRLHQLIPGGCHTYAKGDDQFPEQCPGAIVRGQGCHVWDIDGNEFIEYGMGLRSVTLGHAYPAVVQAAQAAMLNGTNFCRPATIELECAETLLSFLPFADMVKFAKDGSSVTTAAVKLARAVTGREMVALCADQPFFSVHDWFIGTTPINGGVPVAVRDLSVKFHYNDIGSLKRLFRAYPGRIAAVILEPAKYEEPVDNYLHRVKELCQQQGALFILDEVNTGFRWHRGGAQTVYGIEADLSCFGKGIANGHSLAALVGKREYMQRGGLYHDQERVFLLSTTNGAETHGMAAAIATMQVYQQEPVIETLYARGSQLAAGIRTEITRCGLDDYVQVVGRPCNLVFVTRDADRVPSQPFRTLLLQELIARRVLAPSLVISYSHTEADVQATIQAFAAALDIYRDALNSSIDRYLIGRPSQVVYRKTNDEHFRAWPGSTSATRPAFSSQPLR